MPTDLVTTRARGVLPGSPSRRDLSALRVRAGGAGASLERVAVAVMPGSPGTLVLEADGWSRGLELVPSFYGDVVAGSPASGDPRLASTAEGRVSVKPWGAEDPHALFVVRDDEDGVTSLSRSELSDFLARERPVEIERAMRLAREAAADPRISALSPGERADEFERRWEADAIASRVDLALLHAPDRIRREAGSRELVTLWVRRDDLGAAQGRGLVASPLAHAVDQPEYRMGREGPEPTGRVLAGREGVLHLEETFGPGSERKVHLDVGRLADVVGLMGSPEGREAVLAMIGRLSSRSASIGEERSATGRSKAPEVAGLRTEGPESTR